MRILGLIPARGGSKGIPRKNIKLLAGKPLIQYTIDVALQVKQLTKVMVSTDDPEIAEISKSLGAEVPGLRPQELATDESPTVDTVAYTLKLYQDRGEPFDAVCLLQPTCPDRNNKTLKEAIKKFTNSSADSLISVSKVPDHYNPYWVFLPNKDQEYLSLATGGHDIIPRRQDLPIAFYRNGCIYLTRSKVILKQKSLYGKKIGYYNMPDKLINLDNLEDWIMAESMIRF